MCAARALIMGCYAYRKADCVETIAEHVLGIVECQAGMWEFEGFKRKISRIYGVDENIVGDMLIVAAVLHDVGKTRKDFQDRCSEECVSFTSHYVDSALIALNLGDLVEGLDLGPDSLERRLKKLLSCERLDRLDIGGLYLLVVVLPVLLHHYAQIVSESSIFNGLNSSRSFIEIHEDCVNELLEAVNKVSDQWIKSEVGRELLKKFEKQVIERRLELGVINSRELEEFSNSYEYVPGRFIVEAAVGILNLCDGRVAFSNRNCSANKKEGYRHK